MGMPAWAERHQPTHGRIRNSNPSSTSSKRRTLEDSAMHRSGSLGAGAEFSLEYSTHFEPGHTQLEVAKVCRISRLRFRLRFREGRHSALGCLSDSWGYASSSSSSAGAGVEVGAATWQHVAICQLCMHKILCNIMPQTQARRHSWFYLHFFRAVATPRPKCCCLLVPGC